MGGIEGLLPGWGCVDVWIVGVWMCVALVGARGWMHGTALVNE